MTRPPRRPTSRPRRTALAFALAGLLAGTLAGSAPVGAAVRAPAPAAEQGLAAINLHLTPFLSGLSNPVLITHAGDGSGRLFVVEQTGRIKVFAANGSSLGTFLDISAHVSTGGERGLLGLAFHPAFESTGKLYINYTNRGGDTAINEYRVTTNPNRASGARRILTIDQPFANHNGGHLAFGPDGFLYIGMGDGGSAGDPGNRAQSLSTLLGKMLRINVNRKDPGKQYRIPRTNPYWRRTGLDEIWARGLRNPWRFSFDRATGALWIADVGQHRWEEINRSPQTASGAGRAANYGWRVQEGRACYRPSSGCNRSGKVQPLAVYGHDVGCSVSGGYVYRGAGSPTLQGSYLFGDYCSGRIWAVSATAASPATPVLLMDTGLNISSFGEDEAGELYVVDHGGEIRKISAT